MILIPEGNLDTRGIGILEVLWKLMEAVIDTRINRILFFHYVHHGFRGGVGTGTSIVELKLAQELESVD